jgi:LysR family carnitine catabolism transcriptional activator
MDPSIQSINLRLSARDLEAFLALAEAQHFTRAAERCHLSQSAFSQKIARIEREAGVALFERSTRHVTLTPEGAVFVDEVRRIQQDLHHALANLRDLATRRIGKVTVAALPSAAAAWMPQVIARYRDANPHVRVQLFDALAQNHLDMLRSGAVDLAITAGTDLREFDRIELAREPFHLVCRDDHPLARRRWVKLEQVPEEEMVHLARSTSVRQCLEAVRPSAPGRPLGLEVEHLATAAALVAQGIGVTLVPALTLFHFRQPGLTTVVVREPALVRPVSLARRKGKALSVAAQAMAAEIVAEARARR